MANKSQNSLIDISKESFQTHKGWYFVLSFALVAALIVAITGAAPPPGKGGGKDKGGGGKKDSTPTISLYLEETTTTKNISVGDLYTFDIRANTIDQPVLAVQADIEFPASVLEFVSIDSANSAFSVAAVEKVEGNKISFVRGDTVPITGDVLVGEVTLRAINTSGREPIRLLGSSAIMHAEEHVNILESMEGLSVRVRK